MFKKALWLFGVAVFLLVIFLPGYTKLQDFRERNSELSLNIGKLKKENALLQNQIIRLQSDPLYQEKVVRDKMGVVRKGEVAIKVVPENE